MRWPSVRLILPAGLLCLLLTTSLSPAAKAAGGPGILAPAAGTSVFFNPVPLNVYGGFYSPAFSMPMIPPSTSYLGSYWWAGPNAGDDPRQAGYNPSAGYPWNSVTTLLLMAKPSQAHVTLDGTDVGPARDLGPIQLPMGEHTLRVDARGFEPSETVLKVEQPIVQQLDVRLTPVKLAATTAPAT
jgi:hypothetical protein